MTRLWRVIAHALTHDIDPDPGCDRCVTVAARILISELGRVSLMCGAR